MSQRYTEGTNQVVTDAELDEQCPLPQVFALVADKWTVRILTELGTGARRFTELERAVPGISRRMLTLALRSDAQRVYSRAVLQFTPVEISEAFASTYKITSPSQLRGELRQDSRDLIRDFRRLAPSRRWRTSSIARPGRSAQGTENLRALRRSPCSSCC